MKKNPLPFLSIGSSLLLVVFLILCLFSFATLSVSTAKGNMNFSEKNASLRQAYYRACNTAEECVAVLAQGALADAGDTLQVPCTDGNVTVSLTPAGENTEAAFSIPIAEKRSLDVVLRLTGDDVTITRWQTVTQGLSDEAETLHLMEMDSEGE